MTCAVIYMKIDSVNKFELSITAIITERDFRSEYLFRMCYVVTNLVTSLDFKPVRCANTLCHFRRTRNGYVASHFTHQSNTAENNATSGYVVVPERFDQNEQPASRMKEPTRKKPSFVPSSGFNQSNI